MRYLNFLLLASALATSASAQVNYSNDFQGSVGSEWSSTSTTDVDGAGRIGLGAFDNAGILLTIGGFTPGVSATLAFDFYALSSWDGTDNSAAGPDVFSVNADATTLLDASFSNLDESGYLQSYSPGTPLAGGNSGGTLFSSYTGADEKDSLLSYNYYGSSVYEFGGAINPLFSFVPTASTVVFTFRGTGLQGLTDEGWAIDNVRVIQSVPEPASLAALGFGALAVLRRRRAA